MLPRHLNRRPVGRQLRTEARAGYHLLRLANRLAYGKQAAPYDALADFSKELGVGPDPAVLLPAVQSVGFTPETTMRTRTSPGPGTGRSRSTTSRTDEPPVCEDAIALKLRPTPPIASFFLPGA